jgi:hypothetical protein
VTVYFPRTFRLALGESPNLKQIQVFSSRKRVVPWDNSTTTRHDLKHAPKFRGQIHVRRYRYCICHFLDSMACTGGKLRHTRDKALVTRGKDTGRPRRDRTKMLSGRIYSIVHFKSRSDLQRDQTSRHKKQF